MPIDLRASLASCEVIVFDFGNILCDISWEPVLQAWAAATARPVEALAARFGMDEAYCEHERGERDGAAYHRHLCERLGEMPYEAWVAGWQRVFVGVAEGLPGALRRAAERRRLAALTNTNALHFTELRRRYAPLLAPFEQVFSSHELGARKPEAEVFAMVTAALEVAPQHIAFIDDNAANVRAARAFGWRAHELCGTAQVAEALAAWLAAEGEAPR